MPLPAPSHNYTHTRTRLPLYSAPCFVTFSTIYLSRVGIRDIPFISNVAFILVVTIQFAINLQSCVWFPIVHDCKQQLAPPIPPAAINIYIHISIPSLSISGSLKSNNIVWALCENVVIYFSTHGFSNDSLFRATLCD